MEPGASMGIESGWRWLGIGTKLRREYHDFHKRNWARGGCMVEMGGGLIAGSSTGFKEYFSMNK